MNIPATFLAAAPQTPQAVDGIGIQLGAGAIAVGLIVWAVAMIRAGRWAKGPVIVGFAVGTVTAGATGILGMPGDVTTQLITALGTSIGGM